MTKKFLGKNHDVVGNVTLGFVTLAPKSNLLARENKTFTLGLSYDFEPCVAFARQAAVAGVRAAHAIAAQDAVRSRLRTGIRIRARYGGFIDSAAARRFCGCTRIAPPCGPSRSAIRKNASEITTGNTNRNSSPLRRSA
jgi:hypothetical protein